MLQNASNMELQKPCEMITIDYKSNQPYSKTNKVITVLKSTCSLIIPLSFLLMVAKRQKLIEVDDTPKKKITK